VIRDSGGSSAVTRSPFVRASGTAYSQSEHRALLSCNYHRLDNPNDASNIARVLGEAEQAAFASAAVLNSDATLYFVSDDPTNPSQVSCRWKRQARSSRVLSALHMLRRLSSSSCGGRRAMLWARIQGRGNGRQLAKEVGRRNLNLHLRMTAPSMSLESFRDVRVRDAQFKGVRRTDEAVPTQRSRCHRSDTPWAD
jgi:hypothetical protein